MNASFPMKVTVLADATMVYSLTAVGSGACVADNSQGIFTYVIENALDPECGPQVSYILYYRCDCILTGVQMHVSTRVFSILTD